MRKVLPPPAAAPMYTRSRARDSSLARARNDAGDGRLSSVRGSSIIDLHRVALVERKVGEKTVGDWLAKQAELPALCPVPHQGSHFLFGDTALTRDARHLKLGRGRRDMRVKAGARRGDEVDRHGPPRVLGRV